MTVDFFDEVGHRFDLVGLAAVDGRLAAFVVKRVDDHLEFSIAIQIKRCSEVVYIRRNGLIRFRIHFTGYEFCLNIPSTTRRKMTME